MKAPRCMFCIYLKEMDIQCKGSANGVKQTQVFVTSPDVIGTCTSQSEKEKTSQVQARVAAKRAFFKMSHPSENLYSCREGKPLPLLGDI